MSKIGKLANAAHGRRRHYWHVFSRDRAVRDSWVHEIGFDNHSDAKAECEDIRDHDRVPRIIPCLWTDEPAAMVAALNAYERERLARRSAIAGGAL